MYSECVLEPVKQFGEGNYELGNIQMVETTEDFKTMRPSVRECQTETTFEDCVTQRYLELLMERCSCLPFNLQNFSSNNDQVSVNLLTYIYFINMINILHILQGKIVHQKQKFLRG